MRWGRLVGLVALALPVGVACEDDATPPDGAAGAAGGASAAGASGAAGEGDAALWASLTVAPPACESDDDCCVVVNSCLACVGKVDTESLDDGVSHCGDDLAAAGSPGQSFSCDDR